MRKILITGWSRGLGLALARQYASRGAELILCARDAGELERARELLSRYPATRVFVMACDLSDAGQVDRFAREVATRFGTVDVLINNAGIIEVGPIEAMDFAAFDRSVSVNLFGMIRLTLALLPYLRRGARIVNITSIGGAVAVPHLLPYSVSKFGALGFSLGLDAELAPRGISVTSVLPGLMRTGSFVNARFRGNAKKEYGRFAVSASLPLLTLSPYKAARRIVSASQRRRRFVVLGPQAKLLRVLYQQFPGALLGVMRVVGRALSYASKETAAGPVEGKKLHEAGLSPAPARRLARRSRTALNQRAA